MTKPELVAAIREVIADDKAASALLNWSSLVNALRHAGEKAFINELTGSATDTVRTALKMLESPGWFTFEEEV